MSRLFRWLLLAYPRSLRDRHGAEMAAAFDEQWQRARPTLAGRARLLALLVADFVTSVCREWRIAATGRGPRTPQRGNVPMPNVVTDLRTAARHLRRSPLFTLGAILTLGLGIGATTAIFSLADATLLRPLAMAEPDRVYQSTFSWSLPDLRDLESGLAEADAVAGWSSVDFAVDLGGTPRVVSGLGVSGRYFALAGIAPAAGRLLQEADDEPGAPAVAVLGHRFWQSTFTGDPAIVGRTVRLNQRPVTIVGVAPAMFRGLSLRDRPEIFVAVSTLPQLATGFRARPDVQTSRDIVWLNVAARLRPGVAPDTARVAVEQIYRRAHPPSQASNRIPEPVELVPVVAQALGLRSSDDLRRFLAVLAGATIVTLMLTCATVGSLLITRIQARTREFAIRAALGGGPGRIMRLLFFESLGLGMGGALLGLGAAHLTLALLGTFELPGRIVIGDLGVTLNITMLALAAAAGLLTSLIFGLAPMWRASRVPASVALAEGGRGAARRPVRGSLVAVQVAVCVVLLGGSLVFGRAIGQAINVDLGFDTAATSLVTVETTLARRSVEETLRFMANTLDSLDNRPGVTAAAWSKLRPYSGVMMWDVIVPGYQAPPDQDIGDRAVEANLVTGAYFDVLGIPILQGRSLAATDDAGAAKVAVVSESMAKKYWPGQNALGRQFSFNEQGPMLTVVGVVADVQRGLSRKRAPTMYLPPAQQQEMMDFGGTYLVIRSPRDRRGMALASATGAIGSVDADMPITAAATLEDEFRDTLKTQRLGLTLFGLFSALALLLTGLGLGAVVAYTVSQREREIGIRVALGASRIGVLRTIAGQGLAAVLAGLAVGGAGLWLMQPTMDQFLLTGRALSLASVAALACAILTLAAVAIAVPARRALSVEPTVALRND